MSTKLIQKHLLKPTHEFEIVNDQVNISIKSRYKEETLSVTLAVLNPEPVITRTHLDFVSRVNGEPLLSLALSKPNVTEFNNFVNMLKQKALEEYNSISGISVVAKPSTENTGSLEEPPEFGEHSPADISKTKKIDVESIKHSIKMLQTYVHNNDIQPFISALESLQQTPEDHSKLVEVATIFDQLEISQGAVLTYAPYIILMLSDDPFGD
ncbi:MAG: hypothetical protein R8G33_07415 [Gammaproteobacteria bacterium]|nr:hypothetical protein [Gammaproteobacteria bacterium]